MKRAIPFLLMPFVAFAAGGSFYPHPGDVIYRGGAWEGVDHLANLSKSIPLQLNLIVPADTKVTITEGELFNALEKVFKDAGFENATPPKNEHYFFNMLVLVYPVNDGLAASIQGRLFEEVQVRRTLLEKDHKLQAETWDQSTLIVAPTAEFNDLLIKTVQQVATNFVTRAQAFQEKSASREKSEESK